MNDAPVITIDGPSGVGKGTLSQLLAEQLGWHLLDSGALYRVVGLAAQRGGIALDDESALAALALDLPLRFQTDDAGVRVLLAEEDVSAALRTEAAGNAASQVAALGAVRAALLERQRAFQQLPGLVADGRDMGSVVFPSAALKIFLSASPEERANRRYKQLKQKGMDVNLAALIEALRERDARDSARAVAPLRPATDAMLIDTTELSIAEVFEQVLQRWQNHQRS